MFITELDSFVGKFQQLWKDGVTAHLDLDTHAGSAWVGLRVHLGHVPPGPPHHTAPQGSVYPPPRHVSPSRQRRRARREAERKKKAEEVQGVHYYFGHFVFCHLSASKAPTIKILVIFAKPTKF